MIRVVSWNIATRHEPWRHLLRMDADVALLQEATPPPEDVVLPRDASLPPAQGAGPLDIGPQEAWDSHSWNSDWWHGRDWRALYDRWPMVVRLSDRVDVQWFKQIGPAWRYPKPDEIAVSGIGTLTAARITCRDRSVEPFIVISMYGQWIGVHPDVETPWSIGVADASLHRIISDLSAFIGKENPRTHRILAAGDLNITYGYGSSGSDYWHGRYRSVFDRMAALGLEFMGPQAPNGRQAITRAVGEPEDSSNVVTFYLPGKNPQTASNNQLDYAFASRGFHESVRVRAMNNVEDWGPSDHCRIMIDIGGKRSE